MGMKLKEFSDAVLDVCKSYYTDIDTLTADRDRLAAENTELRADLVVVGGAFSHANATLDRLREVVPDGDDNPEEWPYGNGLGCVRRVQSILYPKETDNDLGKCKNS